MPPSLTIDEQIECIKFQFAQLDDAMIQFHQETQIAQYSNNKRLMTLESKVAFIETCQTLEQQANCIRAINPPPPPKPLEIDSSFSSSLTPKHDNCHCVIL